MPYILSMTATHLPIVRNGNGWAVTFSGMQVIGAEALRTRAMARTAARVLRSRFDFSRIAPERLTASAIRDLTTVKGEAIRRANRAADRRPTVHAAVVLGQVAA